MTAHRHDVVIVGAGPVGLMMANLLGERGHDVLVLEKRAEPYGLPRAIAYDAETLRLFDRIGLLEALRPTLLEDVPVRYLNARGRTLMAVRRPGRPFGHSALGSFHQAEMEAVLADGLARFPNVCRENGAEVVELDQDGRSARLTWLAGGTRKSASASWVVGCDGGGSFVRRALGIPFTGQTFSERWLVVDCVGEGYGVREMRFFCDPARPALTLPVSKGRRRWEFLVLPGDDEAELTAPDTVRRLIAGYAPEDASRIERAVIYAFHARNAARWRLGRAFLAGDAAHLNPPFAGQGLNGGFRDANNLAWKLDHVERGVASPAILDSYEAERRPNVEALTRFAIGLGRRIMPTSRARALARDAVMLTLQAIPAHRRYVDQGGLMARPRLPSGALAAGEGSRALLLQPAVKAGGEERMLDRLLGPGWSVVGIDVDGLDGFHPDDRLVLDRIGAAFVSLSRAQAGPLSDQVRPGTCALVRPDRYIAALFRPSRADARLGWLRAALDMPTRGTEAPTLQEAVA